MKDHGSLKTINKFVRTISLHKKINFLFDQVNNRNRNKNKVESSPSNRKTTTENAPVVAAVATTTNENELNDEPIEICQLLPKNENRYTASDKWWKQPLNNQQTFSVDDIGEWPEDEQDEQYIVQVKRIQPTRK